MPIFERHEHVYTATPRPLAELLDCPGPISEQLGNSVERKAYAAGDMVFVQNAQSKGLYLLLGGEFYRSAERREKRVALGKLHGGDLAELAAILGDGTHTYSLMASAPSEALLFPGNSLLQAFTDYPPLRMRLLEELGREVSRAYHAVHIPRRTRAHSGVQI
jgi:CRP-like cAMP-binding protein